MDPLLRFAFRSGKEVLRQKGIFCGCSKVKSVITSARKLLSFFFFVEKKNAN